MSSEVDNFDDIRPFNDAEVPAAVAQIIADPEFNAAIIRYKFGFLPAFLHHLLTPVLGWYLRRHWQKLQTVRDVQQAMSAYLAQALKNTTDGVSYDGLAQLEPNQAYLFVSNHRDITMDPALVSWCLNQSGRETCRIAIGDNLLKKPCVTALMKLNKSFIVRRSAKGPREMLKALSQLSAYIGHSLQSGHHIWIAQREGRAKDGFDQTDPAILKMFYMAGKAQGLDFVSYMQQLNIVPVSISYEYDPCDLAKARELHQRQVDGNYQKAEFEDLQSIIQGITGYKGRIHLQFGQVLKSGFDNPEQLAALIDQQIYQGYRLFPVNQLAAGEEVSDAAVRQTFQQRLSGVPEQVQQVVRQMYANPLLNQRKAKQQAGI